MCSPSVSPCRAFSSTTAGIESMIDLGTVTRLGQSLSLRGISVFVEENEPVADESVFIERREDFHVVSSQE